METKKYPTNFQSYKLLTEIGFGGTATVWKALCIPFEENVAIKIIDLELIHFSVEKLWKEIQYWKLSVHENIVTFYCSFVHETTIWLVMEFIEEGSCQAILRDYFPNGIEDEQIIATILKETLKGITYLHENGQIHRDIKASNLLIKSNGQIKIADFGVAGTLFEKGKLTQDRRTFVGTPCWMSPEVIMGLQGGKGYNEKIDIWSLGITALELAYGKPPFSEHSSMKVLLMILDSPSPTLSEKFSKPFQNFVKVCLYKDPEKRPSAQKLLKHKFLKNATKPEYLVTTLLKNIKPVEERVAKSKKHREERMKKNEFVDWEELQNSIDDLNEISNQPNKKNKSNQSNQEISSNKENSTKMPRSGPISIPKQRIKSVKSEQSNNSKKNLMNRSSPIKNIQSFQNSQNSQNIQNSQNNQNNQNSPNSQNIQNIQNTSKSLLVTSQSPQRRVYKITKLPSEKKPDSSKDV
ncbi:serine/threonine-protein kinase fray2 [Anaeramoeba ignava]|uniref:Serine/threonine-protein kinase fray2 n=1 Tax=Anaeramoeba ignava TaxID=1746090 RepID=A0A9Q0LUP4_ANAIG|nr:serine/threonine-protein kinase fray2 [Anaeramoeba ignava]